MEHNNNLWEYKESINRLQASPQEVEKVKQQIEYSNRLVKAHNVMKVLDLPDNEDNPIRKILLKEDDTTLEELAKKSKEEIRSFIITAKKDNLNNKKILENQENWQNNELKSSLLNKNQNQTIKVEIIETQNESLEDKKNDQKFLKLKSLLPQSILMANSKLAKNFEDLALINDKTATNQEKQQIQDEIINYLKNSNNLKSITDQLWWADKSNPKYQEFKANLLAVDYSGFKPLFDELEKTKSKETPNADTIAKQIEKESGGMINIDLNSKTPLSKMSLTWSSYSFDELIDKKALDEITTEKEEKLDEVQSSEATLKGLAKPFENIANESKQNFWKEDFKDKVQWVINNFPRNIFSEANEMYEKMGIKSDIQIKESDITSLINASSENDLRLKITNIEEKFEKIQAHIEDIKAKIEAKHQIDVKELLSLKSKEQEKQVEVLKFMKDSGFDLIPKEISDKFIRDIQANTLQIPWLDLDTKNINLKNGNFWESVLYKDDGLNIHSKTNMLKFMNKMISWDINQPLKIESIVNGTEKVNPSFLQNKFLETWIVDSLGWREGKISENLGKANKGKIA